MKAYFTTSVQGDGLREQVRSIIRLASELARNQRVELHLMAFSFTDKSLGDSLLAAADHPHLRIRLLADWCQGANHPSHQARRLSRADLANIEVRFKKDQPYVLDRPSGMLTWSYRASRGLLHHKSMSLLVDNEPHTMLLGSFNWTRKALRSFENVLVIGRDCPGSLEIMRRVENEFRAIWASPNASLSPLGAKRHFEAIAAEFAANPHAAPQEIVGAHARDSTASTIGRIPPSDVGGPATANAPEYHIAFSGRDYDADAATSGFDAENRIQKLSMRKPGIGDKRVPLTITTLALDTINRAREGEELCLAMFGLSVRVPEYSALLLAARRGVKLRILLDGRVGRAAARRIRWRRLLEGTRIELRLSKRSMHQKYLLHRGSLSVLTGTANMSQDATARHAEHRILIRGNSDLLESFCRDFEALWSQS